MKDITIKYNLKVNELAHKPFINSAIGVYRVTTNLGAFLYHIAAAVYHVTPFGEGKVHSVINLYRSVTDLKHVARGVVEVPPVIGGLGSLLWDHYLLSPAQKLAFRIQHVYQTRMDVLINYDKTQLRSLTDEDIKNAPTGFKEFINGQSVMISTNQGKIEKFVDSFLNEKWNYPIFSDPQLPFYALAAFAQGRIDIFDMSTILDIYVAKLSHEDCEVYPLLDKKLNWTAEAQNLFLPTLRDARTFVTRTDDAKKEEFRKKLAHLPSNKRLFFAHNTLIPNKDILYTNIINRQELVDSPAGFLYAALIDGGNIRTNSVNNKEVHLSFDAECLFLNIKFRKFGTPLYPKLGTFSTRDIKNEELSKTRRLCAMFFPGVKAVSEVHGSKELPGTIIAHDKGHAYALKKYPEEGVEILLYLVTLFEGTTGFQMSKEIWELTDMVALDILKETHVEANSFMKELLASDAATFGDKAWKKLFFNKNGTPTLLGWITALEFYKSSDRWKMTLPNELEEARKTVEKLIKEKAITTMEPQIVTLWKLMQHAESKPIDQTIQAKDLEFVKVKDKGFKNNTITIKKK